MVPDQENVINESLPHKWFKVITCQSFSFKPIHEYVGTVRG